MDEEQKPTLLTVGIAAVKRRLGEKSTLWGIILLVLALIQNPDVFASLTSLVHTVRTGHNLSAVIAAFASVLLIVLKETSKTR